MDAAQIHRPDWHGQVVEEIVEPERVIVDPHHHLWHDFGLGTYLLEDFWADTASGHDVVKSVFVECRSGYLTEGPEHLRPVGESRFVAAQAEASRAGGRGRPEIAALVARTDLRLGDRLDEVLDGHVEASGGLFRGIRHAGYNAPADAGLSIPSEAPPDLYADEAFRAGVARLGERGFVYETWHYHFQNRDFCELARAVPGTTMVLDHLATPLGVGPWAGRRRDVLEEWKRDLAEVARCENVYVKLGGMAMPDLGFGWHERDRPPTSDEFAEAQRPYHLHAIDCFGPQRAMFESNFPVDKASLSYQVFWNGAKKVVADLAEDEKDALFRGTASRVYSLSWDEERR